MSDNTDQPLPPRGQPPIPPNVLAYLEALKQRGDEDAIRQADAELANRQSVWHQVRSAAEQLVTLNTALGTSDMLHAYLPADPPAGWWPASGPCSLLLSVPGLCPIEFTLEQNDPQDPWKLFREWTVIVAANEETISCATLDAALLTAWHEAGAHRDAGWHELPAEAAPPEFHQPAAAAAHDFDDEIPF